MRAPVWSWYESLHAGKFSNSRCNTVTQCCWDLSEAYKFGCMCSKGAFWGQMLSIQVRQMQCPPLTFFLADNVVLGMLLLVEQQTAVRGAKS